MQTLKRSNAQTLKHTRTLSRIAVLACSLLLSACQISESEGNDYNQSPSSNTDIKGTWVDHNYGSALSPPNVHWSSRTKFIFSNDEVLKEYEVSENFQNFYSKDEDTEYPNVEIKETWKGSYKVIGDTILEDGQVAKKIATLKKHEVRFYSKKSLKIQDVLPESCFPKEETLKLDFPYDLRTCYKRTPESKGLYQIIDGKLYLSKVDPNQKENIDDDGFPKRMFDPNDKSAEYFYQELYNFFIRPINNL